MRFLSDGYSKGGSSPEVRGLSHTFLSCYSLMVPY